METEKRESDAACVTSIRTDVIILIAEDDKGRYVLTKNYLRKVGIDNEIVWLEDGQATLDYLYNGSNALIKGKKFMLLLDIRMPKVDGIEVLERLKQDDNFDNISVIMLTTSEDQQLARRCYDLGCDAHIIKPPGEVLLKAMQRAGERL